jgi:phospholipase/lecithinase/hemolysin
MGDSLSDPGNAFVATGTFVVRPFEPIPSAPYLIGRFHLTNGPTWIEQLARDLGLRRSARPALLGRPKFTNYAFATARARPVGGFDLDDQVDLFLADFEGEASADSLYAVFIGSNDLRDAFVELIQGNAAGAEEIVQAAIGATFVAMQRLADAGARTFLVLNLPDIGNTPSVMELGPEAVAAASGLSEAYNAAFAEALAGLGALNPAGSLAGLYSTDEGLCAIG